MLFEDIEIIKKDYSKSPSCVLGYLLDIKPLRLKYDIVD